MAAKLEVSREAWKASVREHHNALRTGIIVANILPALRTVLTDVEYRCIEAKEGDVARVDELVKILLTKDYSTFERFCFALQTNGYDHWASKLRDGGISPSVPDVQVPIQFPIIDKLSDEFSLLAAAIDMAVHELNQNRLSGLKSCIAAKLKAKYLTSQGPLHNTADELMNTLQKCWDYLNFEFAQLVVQYLGDEQLQKKMRTYEEKVPQEVRKTIEECKQRAVQPKPPPNYVSMSVTVHVDPHSYSLHHILRMKNFLVHEIGIDEALFKGWSEGSITLHFYINVDDVETAQIGLKAHLNELQDLQVTRLEVSGQFCLNVPYSSSEAIHRSSAAEGSGKMLWKSHEREDLCTPEPGTYASTDGLGPLGINAPALPSVQPTELDNSSGRAFLFLASLLSKPRCAGVLLASAVIIAIAINGSTNIWEDVLVQKPDGKLTTEELSSLWNTSKYDLIVVLFGLTGMGSSTLGNFLLGKHVFEVRDSSVSVTDKAQADCSVLDGQRMCIVDTPGFANTHHIKTQNTEAKNLANTAAYFIVELSKTMLMARHGVHVFCMVVQADKVEWFSTTKLLDLLDILGNNYWNHTILVLTHGNMFDKTSEDRQYEKFEAMLNSPNCPEVWKTLIEKVNKRYVIVESEDRKDPRAYHARKVKELKEHSSAIVAAHGPYNDTLHPFLKECIETAKRELRNEFEDMNSPEAQVAALQVAFQNISAMLHKKFCIKLAGGVDTELLQEKAKAKEELPKMLKQIEQLYQQLSKEQEEEHRAQEAEDRAKDAQRAAEEQARVAREAEDKVRRELEEYLKKPIFAERVVETRVSSGNFYWWAWVYSAEAVDVATRITAKADNYLTKRRAKKHARLNLSAILLERGIID